jgi:hypothetical protein
MTVSRELSKYMQGSDGRAVAKNLLEDTHFSTERGMKIMN